MSRRPSAGTSWCTTTTVVLSEVLPGSLHGPESVGVGAVPDLVPLVAHRPVDLPFLVVHAGKEGGAFRAYRLGHAPVAEDTTEQQVRGRNDTLHYAKAGTGWKQPHWQQHTEEIWKQNSSETAAAVDEAVRTIRPGLVVVAGDVTARELLVKALSTETRTLVSVFPGDPRADTGSKQAFVEHVETALARVVATRRHDLEDALRTHVGRGDNQVVTGLGPGRRGAPAGAGRHGRARRRRRRGPDAARPCGCTLGGHCAGAGCGCAGHRSGPRRVRARPCVGPDGRRARARQRGVPARRCPCGCAAPLAGRARGPRVSRGAS